MRTDLLKRAVCGLIGLLSGLFIVAAPAAADPDPPWIDPAQVAGIEGEEWRDTIGKLNWLIQRRHDRDLNRRDFRPFVFNTAYDAAYPFLDPTSDNPALAIAIAERMSFFLLEIKDILLADLKYGPNGVEPDPVKYDHALYKTALHLITNSSKQVFAKGFFFDHTVDVAGEQAAILTGETVRNDAVGDLSINRLGDGSLIEIAKEAIAFVPIVQHQLFETDTCDVIDVARSYLDGSSPVGRDVEAAEMMLHMLRSRFTFERGGVNIFYLTGQYFDEFNIFFEAHDTESLIRSAAEFGHPEAAYEIAQLELSRGNTTEAFQYFLVANESQEVDLVGVIEELRSQHKPEQLEPEIEVAAARVGLFSEFGCRAE